jgi:hypothetical protein
MVERPGLRNTFADSSTCLASKLLLSIEEPDTTLFSVSLFTTSFSVSENWSVSYVAAEIVIWFEMATVTYN